jgi:predicted RNase H-like HicB family nuclease
MRHTVYKVETEVETDGRWIAEIADLPGVLAYGSTEKEAVRPRKLSPFACSPIRAC